MGNKKSQLTKAELEDYKELTYLTEREIQCAFTRFKNLHPRILNKNKHARISTYIIKRMPEFQSNPFSERICEIFSSERDECWSFEDFLDMVSVFSPSTPEEVKAEYAFNIYDFDGDGLLSEKDLLILLSLLQGNNDLEEQEMEDVVDRLMAEADIDQDGNLSLGEFKHILMKCPDFARNVENTWMLTPSKTHAFIRMCLQIKSKCKIFNFPSLEKIPGYSPDTTRSQCSIQRSQDMSSMYPM